MPNIIDDEELYQSIVLAGVTSPGIVTLSGHDSNVEWDVQAGPSQAGAKMSIKKQAPVEFTATFYLTKDDTMGIDDFAAWPAFEELINSTVAKAPKGLDIYHPDLASRNISSVAKGSIGGATYDGLGGQTIVVKFQQYVPPKPKPSAPLSGSKTSAAANDPNAAAKAELDAAVKAYQAAGPWGGT